METGNPFFSVIIPSYNRSGLILRAIDSILNQTFKDYELIIADDCSTDNTEEVVRKLTNVNIQFFKNPVNKGNAGARNLGAKMARGRYVCYIDSDDQFHPEFLMKMYSLIIENYEPGFLWCNVNRIDVNGKIVRNSALDKWKPMEAEDPYVFFLKGLYFGTDFGFTVRRDCFDTTGYFDEDLRVAVDTDFILRIVQDFNFSYTTEALVDTYDHSGSRLRQNSVQKLNAYKKIIQKHRDVIQKHSHLIQRWNYKLMWLCYHTGEKKEAREYLKKAMSADPVKPLLAATIFEIFPIKSAVKVHKKISEFHKNFG